MGIKKCGYLGYLCMKTKCGIYEDNVWIFRKRKHARRSIEHELHPGPLQDSRDTTAAELPSQPHAAWWRPLAALASTAQVQSSPE